MVSRSLMSGGGIMFILIAVVVWGYFFTTPRFWGALSNEFDECEPQDDKKIANAVKHQLNKDKQCVLVKTCASGYIPNSSNTACTSSASPSAPAAVTRTPTVTETRDAALNTYIPDPEWDGYAPNNKVDKAMQYAKIGDKWQVNKCIGGYIPFANADDTTNSFRPKVCKAIGDTCEGTPPDSNTKTLGYTATGKCGSVECNSGYTLYDGRCEIGIENFDGSVSTKWAKSGNKYFVDSMNRRPSYVEIPADEIQTDRSCREMCANIGVSKTGKAFRSLLPTEWKGSVVSKTAPTNRFFNYSIEEIATNNNLWDDDVRALNQNWDNLSDQTRVEALKNAAKCGCEATEDPRYLFN